MIMKTLTKYIKATEKMVHKFIKKYYTYEDDSLADYYLIWWRDRLHAWPLEVCDRYWSLEDIYQALLHNVPKDVLFEWYDYSYAQHTKKQKWDDVVCYNLASRYLWDRVYTEVEKKADERRLKEIQVMFIEEIEKYK